MWSVGQTSANIVYMESSTGADALRWDGSTLTQTAHGGTNIAGVVGRPGGTLMTGINGSGTNFRRSTDDGATWANVASTTAAALVWQQAVGAENGSSTCWIAFSTSGGTTKVQRSTNDGASYADISYTGSLTIKGAAANATTGSTAEWMLVASTGATRISTDNGATFSSGTSLPNSETPVFLRFLNGYFIAGCVTGTVYRSLYYTAAVGTGWSTCYLPQGYGSSVTNEVRGISYFDSKYWVIFLDGQVWSTTDITATPCVWKFEAQVPVSWFRALPISNLGSVPYVVTGGRFFKLTA